jgi:hypothetical protein
MIMVAAGQTSTEGIFAEAAWSMLRGKANSLR